MIIDIFSHIYPRGLLKELQPYVANSRNALFAYLVAPGSPDTRNFSDDEYRIKIMDKYGIDKQALSFPLASLFGPEAPVADVLRLTKSVNNAFSDVCRKHSNRLVPVAYSPRLDGPFLDELDRAIGELGMKGVEIYSNVNGKPLDSPEFIPFFERMEKYGLPVFIHPTNWLYYDWVMRYQLFMMLGWPFDTSLAVSRLVFGGVFDRCPNLKIIPHHLGAMIPFFAERIRGFYDEALEHPEIYGPAAFPYAKTAKRYPMDILKQQLYADTATSGSLAALKCGYEFFGPEHILFAIDFPFGPKFGEEWMQNILKNVEDLQIPEHEKEMIFSGNAERLLKL